MGDIAQAEVRGRGEIKHQLIVIRKHETCFLKEVLYVPDLHYSSLSEEKL